MEFSTFFVSLHGLTKYSFEDYFQRFSSRLENYFPSGEKWSHDVFEAHMKSKGRRGDSIILHICGQSNIINFMKDVL